MGSNKIWCWQRIWKLFHTTIESHFPSVFALILLLSVLMSVNHSVLLNVFRRYSNTEILFWTTMFCFPVLLFSFVPFATGLWDLPASFCYICACRRFKELPLLFWHLWHCTQPWSFFFPQNFMDNYLSFSLFLFFFSSPLYQFSIGLVRTASLCTCEVKIRIWSSHCEAS